MISFSVRPIPLSETSKATLSLPFGPRAGLISPLAKARNEVASDLATRLLAGGAPGLHFYTLNRSKATLEIFDSLGRRSPGAR